MRDLLDQSSDSESDSSISSSDVKRRKKLHYLFGKGEKEWVIKQEARTINALIGLKKRKSDCKF